MQCRFLNRKSHLGLEQISALAASGRTLLGLKKCYKFIVDDTTGETAVICSAFRLLENLQLDCPVGQLLNEAVQAHHKQYKSGTTTLLFLAGSWSKAALNCLQQDIPIPFIVSVMYEALEHCFEVLKPHQISIDSILKRSCCKQNPETSKSCTLNSSSVHPDEVVTVSTQSTTSIQGSSTKNNESASMGCFSRHIIAHASSGLGRETSMHKQSKSKVKMSRHFTTPESQKQEETILDLSSNCQNDSFASTADYTFFTALALSLSHGNEQMMQLAIETYKIQTQHFGAENVFYGSLPELDVGKLVIYLFPGLSEFYSCVSPGFIALISGEQSIIVKCLSNLPLHTIFINGDLTDKYQHPGFNRISNVTVVTREIKDVSKSLEEEWLDAAMDILHKFHVNLILVKGITSPCLKDKCMKENILIIQEVKDSVMHNFVEAMGAITVSYITQVNENCVGTGAHLCFWKNNNAPNLEDRVAVQINTFKTSVITIVLCSPLSCKLQTMEDQFWTCVYRLNDALRERQIFPGAGATELLCLHHLKQLILEAKIFKPGIDAHCSSRFVDTTILYRSQVLQSLADGLTEYLVAAMFNTGMYITPLDALTEVQKCLCNNVGLFPIISEVSGKGMNLVMSGTSDFTKLNEGCLEYNVHDNVTIKLEAWRRALNLVLLVLQADAEIITGSQAKTSTADRKVNFLNSYLSI